jgi:Domain of unknown function (DUF4126)
MHVGVWLALASGIAVAAACGLRAFLPLLLLGLAGRVGLISLRSGASWLSGDLALLALGVATVVEIAADKIPVVDHVLDVIATVVRPAAAWLGAFAVLQAWPTPWAQIAAVVLGTTALAVHGLKAKLRLGSTIATAGHANPFLSFIEDVAAFVTMAIAIMVPALAILIPVLLVFAFRRRPPATA